MLGHCHHPVPSRFDVTAGRAQQSRRVETTLEPSLSLDSHLIISQNIIFIPGRKIVILLI